MTTIRPAEPTDHPTIARLFLELAVPDPPLDEETYRRALLPATRVAIAEDGAIGAYVHFELLPQNLGVRHLVTSPLHRRRGFARSLLLDVIRIARARGLSTWSLNVKPENAAALALYRSLGLAPAYEAEIFRVPWELAAALSEAFGERLPWTIAGPDDDAVIERAFGLATGLFALQRSRGRIVIVVGELRSPAAFASFDPHFPGAFPARAKSPAALAAIARAVATLRVPIEDAAHPHRATSLQLGLEDSASAARALADAGATRLFRVLHLRGPLPA